MFAITPATRNVNTTIISTPNSPKSTPNSPKSTPNSPKSTPNSPKSTGDQLEDALIAISASNLPVAAKVGLATLALGGALAVHLFGTPGHP